jgi:hypothetical protein
MTRSTSMTRFPSVTNPDGLTREELRKFPALFAKGAHPKMSDRYTFLSTAYVIEPLIKDGYAVTHVTQRATRFGHRDPNFTRHLVRLRRLKDKPIVGDVFPEVHLENSHDGQSRHRLFGGLLRLACLNGMAFSTVAFKGIALIHRGNLEEMLKQIREAVTQAGSASQFVEKMAAKKLAPAAQLRFAQKAAEVVFDNVDFDTKTLLVPRREQDKGADLWTIYNVVQENLVRGGIQIQHTTGQGRSATTRGITHIRRELDTNLALWQLAMKMAA